MEKVSIVLPTYNEAQNIIVLIHELQAQLQDRTHEIIVVDDDSPDKTWQKVSDFSKNNEAVQLIHRKNERGLTSAINAGINAATGGIVVWMDCDLSHPPSLLNTLLSALGNGVDAAIASRYATGGVDERDGAFKFQKILSLILSKIAFLTTRVPVQDITSGYIAIKRQTLNKALPLTGDYGEYFIDMLCKLAKNNTNFLEVPYSFKNRQFGESKTSTNFFGYFPKGIKYLRMLSKHANFGANK